MLPAGGNIVVITGDLREPWELLKSPELKRVIDWGEPVALMFASVLHFVADNENAKEILAIWREHVVPGSYLLVSHASPGENPEGAARAAQAWRRSRTPIYPRSPAEIQDFFVGCELVVTRELVTTSEWGTDAVAAERQAVILAALGRYC